MMERRLDDSVRLMIKGEEVEDVGDTQVGGRWRMLLEVHRILSKKIRWQDGGSWWNGWIKQQDNLTWLSVVEPSAFLWSIG